MSLNKLILLALILFCAIPKAGFAEKVESVKVVHVVVALCDNTYQGIVPVPAAIGNGQDAANNLYWGCAYGVKTFFKKDKNWQLISSEIDPEPKILERVVFKSGNTWLVADAYDGQYIKQATIDFLDYAAGHNPQTIKAGENNIEIGGSANLICYIGHNGLMDFELDSYPAPANKDKRDVAIYACMSKSYFSDAIKTGGANPLIWTTNLMSPEAYTLMAMTEAWKAGKDGPAIKAEVAKAYNKYQNCGLKGASRLFATGWQ